MYRDISPEDQYVLIWKDPDIDIDWNIEKLILSDKERHNPMLKDQNKIFV